MTVTTKAGTVDVTGQQLLDRQEIADLQVRYALALDARDWSRLRSCFTPDAVAVYEGIGQSDGYQAIEDICRATLTPLTHSQHLLGNHTAQIDGDTARAQCYLQAQHVKVGTDGGDNYIIAGRYDDEMVRTPEGWRIHRRHLAIWWTEGNPAVVSGG